MHDIKKYLAINNFAFLCDLELQNQKAYLITVFSFSRGASKVLLRPQTTQEVAEILAYCNSRRLVLLFVAFILIVVLNLNNMILKRIYL